MRCFTIKVIFTSFKNMNCLVGRMRIRIIQNVQYEVYMLIMNLRQQALDCC
jgi:hypothetical protein